MEMRVSPGPVVVLLLSSWALIAHPPLTAHHLNKCRGLGSRMCGISFITVKWLCQMWEAAAWNVGRGFAPGRSLAAWSREGTRRSQGCAWSAATSPTYFVTLVSSLPWICILRWKCVNSGTGSNAQVKKINCKWFLEHEVSWKSCLTLALHWYRRGTGKCRGNRFRVWS